MIRAPSVTAGEEEVMPFTLRSASFEDGQEIPETYTGDGRNQPPSLEWSGAPEETRGYALIVHDPDAPKGDLTHWVVADIPADQDHIPEGASPPPAPALEGENDFGEMGYAGPRPPRGHGKHNYLFELFALDTPALPVRGVPNREILEQAMSGHVLAVARCRGTYERK